MITLSPHAFFWFRLEPESRGVEPDRTGRV